MSDSFGARLRERREAQQIALATIAEQTKISVSLLEGLERDDVSHWPGGIFRRSFIRSYAEAIGLVPDVIVREFLELYPDPIDALPAASAVAPDAGDAWLGSGPPTRFRYLVGSVTRSLSNLGAGLVQKPRLADPIPATPDAASAIPDASPAAPDLAPAPDPTLAAPDPPLAVPDPTPVMLADENSLAIVDSVSVEPAHLSEGTVIFRQDPDLLAAAELCTELACVEDSLQAAPFIACAARILGAIGAIVWVWDSQRAELRPELAHGYSETVLAQIPSVQHDADNATAAAFRSAQACIVMGNDSATGALVVPLITQAGCVGVLALELPHGSEQSDSVRAVATVFAAQLARLFGASDVSQLAERRVAYN